jgi:hypothetical protein
MIETNEPLDDTDEAPLTGMRMIRIIIIETLAVAIVGFLVLGVAAEMGWYRVGFIAAIVIWVGVSPIIEIATVLRFRAMSESAQRRSQTPAQAEDRLQED